MNFSICLEGLITRDVELVTAAIKDVMHNFFFASHPTRGG